MGPSIFVRQTQEPSPPPRSRLKTLSAFLNPFSSSTSSSQSPEISHGKGVTPSAPIPYHPPKTDISLTDLGHIALGGSPFRVYMKDGSSVTSDGLPSSGLPSTITTPKSARQVGSVSGLPSSHYPLEALHHVEKSIWKEMPTLASAINIADATSASTPSFKHAKDADKSLPLPKGTSRRILPRSASSTSSIFEAYKNRKTLRRSSSRSSTKADQPENQTAEPHRPSRKMSRRLSFDNIRLSLSGSQSRRQNLSGNTNQVEDQRWSVIDKSDAPSIRSNTPDPIIVKSNRLALPPMRGLRNKFSVGPKSGGLVMANVKAEVAARKRIHEWENSVKSAGSGRPDGGSSMGSSAGRGVLRRMEGMAHPLSDAPTVTDPPQSVSLPLSNSLYCTNPDEKRMSTMAIPASSPQPIPSPRKASKTEQTPGHRLGETRLPSSSRATLLFSPAVDDKSIVDPSRSPFPFGISTDDLTSLPPLPVPPPREPLPKPPKMEEIEKPLNRQQSLSEIKDAFGRMRDLSGLDVSSSAESLPSTATAPATDLIEPTKRDPSTSSRNDSASGLSGLDQGLKEVVRESMREVELGTPIKDLPRRRDSSIEQYTTKKSSRPSSEALPEQLRILAANSDECEAEERVDAELEVDLDDLDIESDPEEGVLSRAQSGRSWHTAREDDAAALPARSLPQSKSRSTHDIASLASAQNLVDHTEKTQGEGWWSAERPKGLQRRASNVEPLRRQFDREEDRRLQLLEKLAKSSGLPSRSRFADSVDFDCASIDGRENVSGRETPVRRASAFETARRPMSSMEVRPGPALAKIIGKSRYDSGTLQEWRPSSVQVLPRTRPIYHGPRPSLVAGSIWGRESRSSLGPDDTPTRPSGGRGQFTNSRISPDIARRASCLTSRIGSNDESTGSHTEDWSKATIGEDSVSAAERKITDLNKKHALELDAILGALSGAKGEVKALTEELGGLKKELSEMITEREVLKEKLKNLELRLGEMESTTRYQHVNIATRGRSVSITSTLLPDLQVPNESLVMDLSPLEPVGSHSPENRGVDHKTLALNLDDHSRLYQTEEDVSLDTSLRSGSASLPDEDNETEEAEWTLRLRKNDEAHLDDL